MSYITVTPHQVALVALLPKRGGATAQALAQASTVPFTVVAHELRLLAEAGVLAFNEASGEYSHSKGNRHE